MGERSNALAEQFEQAIADFAAVVKALPEERWSAMGGNEGYTVAATAQHVSGQFALLEMKYISAAAEGKPMPSYSWDDVNGINDRRAEANKACTKAQVLGELRDDGASMAAYIRTLSDEQLDRTGTLALAGGAAVSAEQLIEGGVLIDHVRGHMKSIQ